ncbi:MAG: hypothetical protein KC550_05665 [Nanoarchaeota archaeon]|nr:hypothetical protein [Nanoarchaeota archaeon]
MEKSDIKNYLLEHRNSYSKEALVKKLIDSGATKSDIDSVYDEIENGNVVLEKEGDSSDRNSKSISGWALGLAILAIFTGLGIILAPIALYLGIKARRINKSDGMALAAIIISSILLLILLALIIFFIVWMTF